MKPISVTEQLMFSTTKLIASNGNSGTGFFFHFKFDKTVIPILVTNKHVVNDNPNENMVFKFHTHIDGIPQPESIIYNHSTRWIFHETHDLCFCFLSNIIREVESNFKVSVFYIPFAEDLIYSDSKLSELSAVEDVLMVGYPIGLHDALNNFPLIRKGITSSHPFYDFNEKSIGIADIACFPGSSGSPIVIFNANGYTDKNGNINLGSSRFIFLGVQYAAPFYNAKGELLIENTPTSQKAHIATQTMTNLAYYIKASEILKFREFISVLLQKQVEKM